MTMERPKMSLDEIETLIEAYGISVRRYEQLDSHEYYSAMVEAKNELSEAIETLSLQQFEKGNKFLTDFIAKTGKYKELK